MLRRRMPHGLPVTRRPFAPPPDFKPVIWALARCGYIRCEAGGFVWTDRVAPMMIQAGEWTAEGRSLEDRAAWTKSLADRIWGSIEPDRRACLARALSTKSRAERLRYIDDRWTGDRLRLAPRPKEGWHVMPPDLPSAVDEIMTRLSMHTG